MFWENRVHDGVKHLTTRLHQEDGGSPPEEDSHAPLPRRPGFFSIYQGLRPNYPSNLSKAWRDIAESARFGIFLSGWNALEFGTHKLVLKALPPRNPALLRFSTLTEGFVRGVSRLLGASTPVRTALASAGSTAGIQLSAAFAAGFVLGVGLNYLPTLWGGQELSEHIAQGLEWAFGPAPEWLCEMF